VVQREVDTVRPPSLFAVKNPVRTRSVRGRAKSKVVNARSSARKAAVSSPRRPNSSPRRPNSSASRAAIQDRVAGAEFPGTHSSACCSRRTAGAMSFREDIVRCMAVRSTRQLLTPSACLDGRARAAHDHLG
jgi:hypothetical protein